MSDQIHTRHIGTVTYQGTESDLRAWGVWHFQSAEPKRGGQ